MAYIIALLLIVAYLIFVTIWLFKICNYLMKLEKNKFELRKGETLIPCTLRFLGSVDVVRTDTKEPVDQITVIEYSNIGAVNANKRKS